MNTNALDGLKQRLLLERAARGVLALGARQVLVQGLNIGGGILLARLLTPREFGLFAILTFVRSFFNAFGDVGLAGSLIRQPATPTRDDYRTVFSAQLVIVASISGLLAVFAPSLASAYGLSAGDAVLFRLLALSFLATSFMVIPQVGLERDLEFGKLAVIEVAQALVFNLVAVGLAWQGYGAISFALAMFGRALVGAVLAYIVNPWRIGWGWNAAILREHLNFGLPYQGSKFVSLVKDSITPVLVGMLLGPADVGYLNWANTVAAYSVLAIFIFERVYLPAFSRLQDDLPALGALFEKVIWATNALTAPIAMTTLVLIQPITRIVFGDKWLVALPYFFLLWAANLVVPIATPSLSLLNALGRARVTFAFTFVWMAGTWVLGAPLILMFGAIGFAVANAAVQFTNFLLFSVVKRLVPVRLARNTVPVWGIASVTGILLFAEQHFMPITTLWQLIVTVVVAMSINLLALALMYPSRARYGLRLLRSKA